MKQEQTAHAYREVRTIYDDTTIRVYHVFRAEIAEEAVRLGTFGGHFSRRRMTQGERLSASDQFHSPLSTLHTE